jgi:ubiquinone/menaquinone biosynthesis C-methylase UbiE
MDGRFDEQVAAWDAYTRSPGGRLRRELILRNLSAHPPSSGGKRVLDAAGGVGDVALELAQAGYQVTLLDISARMLELAAERAAAAELENLVCVCADATELEARFSPTSFDLILAHSLLAFIPDPTDTLAGLARLLVPGGVLSLVFGNRHHFPLRYALKEQDHDRALEALASGGDDWVAGTDLFGLPRRVFDPAGVKKMVAEAGLQTVGIYGLRVFTDLVPGDFDPILWLPLEKAAGAHPAFWPIARFIQIIASRE